MQQNTETEDKAHPVSDESAFTPTTGRRSSTENKGTISQDIHHSQTANFRTGQSASSAQTNEPDALKIDRSGIRSLLFQRLTWNEDRKAGQKEIIDPKTIQKILDCIEQAPKTKTTFLPVPGTQLILSCKDAGFSISLQHGNILQYKDRFYQVDAKLQYELLALYTQADEQEQPITIE